MFFTSYAFYFFTYIVNDIAHNYDGENSEPYYFDHIQLFFNIDTTNIYQSGLCFPDGIQLIFYRGLDTIDSALFFGNEEQAKTSGLLKLVERSCTPIELKSENNNLIFPNPARDYFQIHLENTSDQKYIFFVNRYIWKTNTSGQDFRCKNYNLYQT